jgi:HEAT repeat protein
MLFRKKSPEEETLKKYTPFLKSKNVGESLNAVSTIVSMGSNSPETMGRYIVSLLPQMLKDGDTRIHSKAAFIAAGLISASPQLREDLVKYVIDLLRHNDPAMKLYAAGLLGRVAENHPEGLKPHIGEINRLFDDANRINVWAAANALGEIGYRAPQIAEDFVPFLDEQLRGKKPLSRFLSVITYGRISLTSPTIVKNSISLLLDTARTAQDPDGFEVGLDISLIIARLMNARPDLVEAHLMPHVNSFLEEKNPVARGSIVYLIGELGMRQPHLMNRLLPKLTQLCNDNDVRIRALMALALGRMSYRVKELAEVTAPELMKLLEDREDRVRGAAAISLRYIAASSPERIEPIIPKLSKMLEDNNKTTRSVAGFSLMLVSKVAPDLIGDIIEKAGKVIAEGYASARRGAGFALHFASRYPDSVIDRGLLPEALSLMEDTDPNVRGRGVMALKNMAPVFPDFVLEHLTMIMRLLEDKDGGVRMCASYALAEIADYHREAVKEIALERMVKLLDDSEQRVRAIAGLCLGRIS